MKTYVIPFEGDSIKCLFCGRTSSNPGDVKNRYCANCHFYHDDQRWTDLGPCCACEGESGLIARNFITLNFLAPVPGTGWACVACDLPANGAVAVVCDDCLVGKPLRFAIDGRPAHQKRVPVEELSGDFEHDENKHQDFIENSGSGKTFTTGPG